MVVGVAGERRREWTRLVCGWSTVLCDESWPEVSIADHRLCVCVVCLDVHTLHAYVHTYSKYHHRADLGLGLGLGMIFALMLCCGQASFDGDDV